MHRARLASVAAALAILAACSSKESTESVFGNESRFKLLKDTPPPPVTTSGNPVERYADDGGSDAMLQIPQCSAREPFMCSDSDGHPFCSSRPCIPDCTRVGCLGTDECKACASGGKQCVPAGGSC